jgi:hypothetical protein
MRVFRVLLVAAALAAPALPAAALDVTFSGDVDDICSLAVNTSGVLKLSADGTILGSDQPNGVPAVLAIVSLGINTITVGAPTLTDQAAGYVATGQTLKVGYTGGSLLTGVSRAIAPGSSTFSVGLLGAATILTIDNQIVNPGGFAKGHYETTTVVTCS